MVSLLSLAPPILVSAALVFVASSIIHMVLRFHRNDYRKVPGEDAVQETLRRLDVAPGDYLVPYAGSHEAMKQPEFVDRMNRGPIVIMTVAAGGSISMGRNLLLWFLYSVVVSIFAGYVSGRALGVGAPYMEVFRFVGTVAFVGYSLALLQHSIWYKRSWATTTRSVIDGLIYGLLTAGTFGWLWPS